MCRSTDHLPLVHSAMPPFIPTIMLNLLNPKRVRSGARQTDYHLMEDDSFQIEKGDNSLSSTATDSGEDEAPMIAPPPPLSSPSSKAKNGARRAFQRLAVLLPSFLHRKTTPISSAEEKEGVCDKKPHPTAWLGESKPFRSNDDWRRAC